MALLLGAVTIGLILSLLTLGMFVSFRVLNFADITADGSITAGAAVAASLIVAGVSPVWATALGAAAGAVAGAATGILHTKFRIHGLLAGVLVMTALYSINLHVMGKSNVPLLSEQTLATQAEAAALRLGGNVDSRDVWGWELRVRDAALMVASLVVSVVACIALYIFFRTNLGTALRATGDNPQMVRALGCNIDRMIILGLALSNGLIGLSGALLAQYQGFADVQMGIGMLVWGLASVIIGEALVGRAGLGLALYGAIIGTVIFRLLVAIALRWGLNPNDLKLVTAVFVFAAMVLPQVLALSGRRLVRVSHA